MMKVMVVLGVLFGISASYSILMQNAFMFYQQPMHYMAPQQIMYGTYYRNHQLRNQVRSAGVSAFAVRNNIATESHLKDCQQTDVASADLAAQGQDVQSVADAYPEEQFPQEDIPQDEQFQVEDVSRQDIPAVGEVEAEEPIADEPVATSPAVSGVNPDKQNKKNVTFQLDSEEDEEEEQDSQVSRRGASRPATPSAYFPINFGSNSGGAIAIANSYSTGKEGSVVSTSRAYGSPAAADLRRSAPVQWVKPGNLRVRQ